MPHLIMPLLAAAAASVLSTAAADILHVPGDFPTIQEAIDAAVDGDEVEVHPGTYNEAIDFLGKAITVYSTDGPDVTIIDAQQTGTVVTCSSGEGPDSMLEGFTITGGDAGNGGGMHNIKSSPTVTNCTISGNSANETGGGMFNADDGSPTVTNCTFSGNSAPSGANLFATDQFGGHSMPTVNNSVIHGSGAGSITDVAGALTVVNYSDVQGGWPGIGNIDADPLFVDPDNDDFHLSSGSPCIDAGNNWGVPIDENDNDEDGVLCELFPVDLDGNPRFNADEADFDPGCGVPVVVDMGAYEYQFDPADQVTFADLNGDGAVGVKDLLGLLGSWGPCAKGCCLADLDIDGAVGVTDLLIILGNWGPCPRREGRVAPPATAGRTSTGACLRTIAAWPRRLHRRRRVGAAAKRCSRNPARLARPGRRP